MRNATAVNLTILNDETRADIKFKDGSVVLNKDFDVKENLVLYKGVNNAVEAVPLYQVACLRVYQKKEES